MTSSLRDAILPAYDEGRFLQAVRACEALGGLHAIRRGPLPAVDRLLIGRLLIQLGNHSAGAAEVLRAWRSSPEHDDLRTYAIGVMLDVRGALEAWRMLRAMPISTGAEPAARVQRLCVEATTLASFRDFERADELLAAAEGAATEHQRVCCARADVLHLADRTAEALSSAERACEGRPWHPGAIQRRVHLLAMLGRAGEAIALADVALAHLETPWLAMFTADLLVDAGDLDRARAMLDRCDALAVESGRDFQTDVRIRQVELAYLSGRIGDARKLAEGVDPRRRGFRAMANALAKGDATTGRRVVLPVPFVRQHYDTCAPASLAAIARSWAMAGEHGEIASEICFGGTSRLASRRWAERRGWTVAQFSVNVDAAAALIDRGVPFTMTTEAPHGGHMQVVMGYDSRLGSLVVRDSNLPRFIDVRPPAETGARLPLEGMAMVPSDRADLLAGLELQGRKAFDALHEAFCALDEHRRNDADKAIDRLETMGEEENGARALALLARMQRAYHDGHAGEALAAVDALLDLAPDDPTLSITRLGLLHALGRHREEAADLERLAQSGTPHPIALQQLAQRWCDDPSRRRDAERLLHRSRRRGGDPAGTTFILGSLMSRLGRPTEARELFRLATCLAPTDGRATTMWLRLAHESGREDEVLAFLRRRVEVDGERSAQPALALIDALERLHRREEAIGVADAAMASRPDDAQLRLRAATLLTELGELEQAESLVQQAERGVNRAEWLGAAALVDRLSGRHRAALEKWEEAASLAPLSIEVRGSLARILGELEGPDAALAMLERVLAEHPGHQPMAELYFTWAAEGQAERAFAVASRHVEAAPSSASAWSMFAAAALAVERPAEAARAAARAIELDGTSARALRVLAALAAQRGDVEEASRLYRAVLDLDATDDEALTGLVRLLATQADLVSELRAQWRRIEAQRIPESSLWMWGALAHGALPSAEARDLVRSARRRHPSSSGLWILESRLFAAVGAVDAAMAVARESVERFPREWRCWFELGVVCGAALRRTEELAALTRSMELSPTSELAPLRLAEIHVEEGRREEAIALLGRFLASNPRADRARCRRGELLLEVDRHAESLEEARKLLNVDPLEPTHWGLAVRAAIGCSRQEEILNAARTLVEQRPRRSEAWRMLAGVLESLGRSTEEEYLDALRRGVELDPADGAAATKLAVVLQGLGRNDEAARMIDGIPPHARTHLTAQHGIWLAAEMGDGPAFTRRVNEAFRFAALPEFLGDLFDWLFARESARWRRRLFALLDRRLREGDLRAGLAAAWTTAAYDLWPARRAESKVAELIAADARMPRQLALASPSKESGRQDESMPPGRAALDRLLTLCAMVAHASCLKRTMRRHAALAASDDELWGKAALKLLQARLVRTARRWTRSWQEHPGLAGDQLLAIVISLAEQGRREEARQALERATATGANQHRVQFHHLIAIDDALRGQLDAARMRLARFRGMHGNPMEDSLEQIAHETIELLTALAAAGDRAATARAAEVSMHRMREAFAQVLDGANRPDLAVLRRRIERVACAALPWWQRPLAHCAAAWREQRFRLGMLLTRGEAWVDMVLCEVGMRMGGLTKPRIRT